MERHVKQKEMLPVHKEVANLDEGNVTNGIMSENWLNDVFRLALDSIIVFNRDGKIVDVNPAFCSIMKEEPFRIIGKTLYDLIPQEKHFIFTRQQMLLEQVGQAKEVLPILTQKGLVYFEAATFQQADTYLNISIMRDITERCRMEKKLQEQLQKSDRLNVIGELAAGIAHEIRNPMTALKGFIQLLEGTIRLEHDMYYQVITSELARIDSIIDEFLILAKPQTTRFQETDINQILRETVDLLNAQAVLYNVQFTIQYDNSIPPLYVEPNQLKKVFVNIIKNAIEVMPDGGIIDIITKKVNGNQMMISIKDHGAGIPQDRIQKLGEPFYTTKEHGTGLGLMVSYKIIEEHKGAVQVESVVGEGSTFHITLPFLKRAARN